MGFPYVNSCPYLVDEELWKGDAKMIFLYKSLPCQFFFVFLQHENKSNLQGP